MDTKITPINQQPDDAADELAKEIIARFCDTTNKFMKDRVRLPFAQNPLMNLRLPYAPLAAKIRECALKLTTPEDAGEKENHLDVWFDDKKEPDKTVESVNTRDLPLTLESVVTILDGKPLQLSRLATALNAEQEAVREIIDSPDSGLTITGPSKWVKAA